MHACMQGGAQGGRCRRVCACAVCGERGERGGGAACLGAIADNGSTRWQLLTAIYLRMPTYGEGHDLIRRRRHDREKGILWWWWERGGGRGCMRRLLATIPNIPCEVGEADELELLVEHQQVARNGAQHLGPRAQRQQRVAPAADEVLHPARNEGGREGERHPRTHRVANAHAHASPGHTAGAPSSECNVNTQSPRRP